MHERLKIAVVGAGVSGLVAAHRLAGTHAVTLFEASAHAGGHACTVDVAVPEGGTVAADVGFMVLNDRTYPLMHELLAELGVATRTSDMSFSVSDGEDFEYAGHSLRALFANRRHLVDARFLRMAFEYGRFNREARRLLASDEDPPLREWLAERGFSQHFVERLLVPQAAAVWSADPELMWTFPARFLVRFFANHGMLSLTDRPVWQTIPHGSRSYVNAICEGLGDAVRLGSPVCSVHRTVAGVQVTVAGGVPEMFDEVVLACHADQALEMLDAPTRVEREVLGAIRYQPSELVLHSDERLLPRRAAARASWNAHLVDPAPAGPALTYDLRRLQGLDTSTPVLATLNLTERIDPEKVHASFAFAHPIFTPEGVAAQGRHGEISGADRIHYAGAYWSWGFHEDGVASAHRVARAIDSRPPLAVAA